ncbi:MAG: protein-export chaperone SecB [Hyphomicrobiaceae bacterium]
MANSTNGNGNDIGGAGQGPNQASVQVQVAAQYIKDLSFENPNVTRLLSGPGESPNLQLEINVGAKNISEDLYESEIDFKGHATNDEGTIYEIELIYAGLFRVKNIPSEALEPFLLINCPSLIFPFLRRLVADITREGGFPPLLLDPVDFASLFAQRKQAAVEQGATSVKPS